MLGAFGYEGKFFNDHQVKIACFSTCIWIHVMESLPTAIKAKEDFLPFKRTVYMINSTKLKGATCMCLTKTLAGTTQGL